MTKRILELTNPQNLSQQLREEHPEPIRWVHALKLHGEKCNFLVLFNHLPWGQTPCALGKPWGLTPCYWMSLLCDIFISNADELLFPRLEQNEEKDDSCDTVNQVENEPCSICENCGLKRQWVDESDDVPAV